MARSTISEEKEYEEAKQEQVKTESKESSEKVEKPVKSEPTVGDEKKVRIVTSEEIDCWIGGVHYVIGERKDASVPSDVAAILCSSRKAYRK